MKSKLLIQVVLFSTLLFIVGCGGNNTDPQNGDKKDSLDGDSTGKVVSPPKPVDVTQPQTATLLFDASGSMAGYLNGGDPGFTGVISSFENIPNSIDICLYGEREENPIEKDAFDNMLNRRNIRWSNESNLLAMVGSMVQHIDDGNDVCFLITDGILSGSNSDINHSPEKKYNIIQRERMSNDLRATLEGTKGRLSALIVRYTAMFNGNYSCYDNTRVRLNHSRPFYVVALGEWKYIKYIETKLEKDKKESSLSTAYDEIVMIGDSCSYQKLELSEGDGLNYKNDKWYVKRNADKFILTACLDILPTYMQTEEYLKENIQLWVGNTRLGVVDNYEVSVSERNNSKILQLAIYSSQVKGNCKLHFKLKYAFPQWIQTKSDQDDLGISQNPDKMDKTFNLQYFVEGFKVLHEGEFVKEITKEFN